MLFHQPLYYAFFAKLSSRIIIRNCLFLLLSNAHVDVSFTVLCRTPFFLRGVLPAMDVPASESKDDKMPTDPTVPTNRPRRGIGYFSLPGEVRNQVMRHVLVPGQVHIPSFLIAKPNLKRLEWTHPGPFPTPKKKKKKLAQTKTRLSVTGDMSSSPHRRPRVVLLHEHFLRSLRPCLVCPGLLS